MMGVVLWSDALDRKAVIWCEDQGDLAFLNSTDEPLMSDGFFDAGDLVQFDIEVHATMRRVQNPRLVVEKVGAALPDALLKRAPETPTLRSTARIIPFARNDESEAAAHTAPRIFGS